MPTHVVFSHIYWGISLQFFHPSTNTYNLYYKISSHIMSTFAILVYIRRRRYILLLQQLYGYVVGCLHYKLATQWNVPLYYSGISTFRLIGLHKERLKVSINHKRMPMCITPRFKFLTLPHHRQYGKYNLM